MEILATIREMLEKGYDAADVLDAVVNRLEAQERQWEEWAEQEQERQSRPPAECGPAAAPF